MTNRQKIIRPGVCYGLAGLMLAGCASSQKTPLVQKSPEPMSTAVSGAGDFAPNEGAKNPAKIYLAYGQWAEQMGQYPEARDAYNKVLAEQPKNIDALLGLARVDQASGLVADAEEHLQKAQKLAGKDARVLAACGNFLAAQGQWKPALEKLEAAVQQAPDDGRYQFLLAVALARSGDIDAAYPYFVRSVGEAQAHFNIGYILNEQGNREGSIAQLEQAVALMPDLTPARDLLDQLRGGAGTMLAGGSNETPERTGVRAIPLNTREERLPLQGNERLLMGREMSGTNAAMAAQTSPQEPPPNLTPAQLEQWRNQQEQ
jgi:tetratricopeptide (TPR) repeat protein